jgi:hypothetical protein
MISSRNFCDSVTTLLNIAHDGLLDDQALSVIVRGGAKVEWEEDFSVIEDKMKSAGLDIAHDVSGFGISGVVQLSLDDQMKSAVEGGGLSASFILSEDIIDEMPL